MRPTAPTRAALAVALVTAAMIPSARAQDPIPGLRDLPVPRAGRSLLFSSRDPSGGNDDHGHYLAIQPDGGRILAQCAGPGRIVRLWSANPTGELRIVLDGETFWDGPFAALLGGATPGFEPPLVGRGQGGGYLSMVPMPFAASCVVTARPSDPAALYYQVGIELHRAPADPRNAPPAAAALDRTTTDPRFALLDPGYPRDAARRTGERTVDVGAAPAQLFEATEPIEVVELRVRPTSGTVAEPWARGIWIEVWLAGEDRPSVQVPLGDFFGVAFDGDGIETLPIHGLGAWRVQRLPMPMPAGSSIRLVPVGSEPAAPTLAFDIAFRPLPGFADPDRRRLPLRASFRRAINRPGEPFDVLAIDPGAPGHYVGAFFAFAGASGQGLTFLEGDETIAIDGEETPSVRGTGTEDDLNGAWYFRGGTFGAPWHAVATLDERRGRVAAARLRGPDPIPFRSALRVRLEHGGQDDAPGSDYAATAFWYGGQPPARTDAEQRVLWSSPQASAAPIALRFGAPTDLVLDAADPEQALLVGRRVLIESAGEAARVVDVDASGRGIGRVGAGVVRVSPWLDAIRALRVVGPFRPTAPRRGIDDVFGPERDASPDTTYEDVIDGQPPGWRSLPEPGAWSGYVDLDPLFSPNDGVVAYAACEISSPREQDVVLVLGSDDAVKVFLDGREVHRKVLLRGAGRDQDRVPLRLPEGPHTLLIKVEDYLGGFGLFARLEGGDGLRIRAR